MVRRTECCPNLNDASEIHYLGILFPRSDALTDDDSVDPDEIVRGLRKADRPGVGVKRRRSVEFDDGDVVFIGIRVEILVNDEFADAEVLNPRLFNSPQIVLPEANQHVRDRHPTKTTVIT